MSESDFSCCNGKSCLGPGIDDNDLDRRDFMKAVAAGFSVAAVMDTQTAGASPADLESWNASLVDRGQPRIYRGEALEHIAMPLGGIGAGQVYLRGDGTLNPWQNFNNFNSNAIVPRHFFAVRSAAPETNAVTRLLQLSPHGAASGVQSIEFTGEYPFATLRYFDEASPVQIELEAFSPFVPLNTKDSGLPAVIFRFRVHNTSSSPVDASILAAIPNLIGWDGYARLEEGPRHSEFGGNTNSLEQREGATILSCASANGVAHAFANPISLYTNDADVAYHMRHCGNMKVFHGRPWTAGDNASDEVLWVTDELGKISERELAALLQKTRDGATTILAADAFSLIHDALNKHAKQEPIVLFEDFESGTFDQWQIEGDAFGVTPATGTYQNQQNVSGWQGTYYLNSYAKGDGPTGVMKSRAFTIEHRFIHFLVGGGDHASETCVNLMIDGVVIASERGQNTEQLRPVRWDVAAHQAKTATIEIVDRNTGGWGHILADHFQFSNSPRAALTDPAVAEQLRDALPFRARSTRAYDGKEQPLSDGAPLSSAVNAALSFTPAWTARGFKLKDRATVLLQTETGVPLVIEGKYGDGRIFVCNGSLERKAMGNDRKAIIGAIISAANGIAYAPQTGMAPTSPLAGTMALGILPEHGVTVGACAQFSRFEDLWQQFEQGALTPGISAPSPQGASWMGALCGSVTLAPNEERNVSFVLSWHLPNRTRDDTYGWGPQRYQYDHRLGNQYANWFASASEVIGYVAENEQRLREETERFHTTFHNSTLPQYCLDAVSANASIVRSPIYVWIEDGTVAGFEGSDRCCPMNCTHVYNYAMSAAYLFPSLERNVRETDLLVQMHPTEHYIPHRTVLPLSLPRLGKQIGGPEHPALDGELGTVLKTYREWLMYGDRAWLEKMWPRVRALMLYLMRTHDVDGDGVIKGEQPNTYDTHLFGSNTFIGTLYLAALRAAEEMANLMNDAESAKIFRDRFELGREGYDRICWNGEYYYNVFDAPNADAGTYNNNNCYGPGCFSDQLLGQWWAHTLGLGYVLPEDRVKSALQAIHHYNWRADLTDHHHTQRVFAKGTEKGLLVGSWPKGGRPERPILYCDEVWTGIEYHVAATMLYEGMIGEGMQIVRGARERYTGNQRNPWSEIECGGHYARAMSSYSLLHAAAGFVYDAGAGTIKMSPRITPENFKGFFTAALGWGSLSQHREADVQRNSIDVQYGSVKLSGIVVATPRGREKPAQITVDYAHKKVKSSARFANGECSIAFRSPIKATERSSLHIEMRWV